MDKYVIDKTRFDWATHQLRSKFWCCHKNDFRDVYEYLHQDGVWRPTAVQLMPTGEDLFSGYFDTREQIIEMLNKQGITQFEDRSTL